MIYFDIETIPCDDQDLIDVLSDSIKPPKSIKKKESLDKWYLESFKPELDRAVSKTSLDGLYGRVACIAWAHDDGEIRATEDDSDELENINYFYDWLDLINDHQGIFCGHNLHGFDLQFLKHRSIVHGLKPPEALWKAMNSKPWDGCVADTMLMWSSEKNKMVSMRTLCKVLGIDYEDDMDGSMVAETWLKDPQKVIDYCKDDVERTRQIYKRLTFS